MTIAASFVAGCGEELGPERCATTRVAGQVLEGRRPLAAGWIEFLPIEGTVGDMRSAPLGADGRFTADRVPVGRVAIGLVGAPIRMVVNVDPGRTEPGRVFFDSLGAKIRKTVPAEGLSDLTLELHVETERWLAERDRARQP